MAPFRSLRLLTMLVALVCAATACASPAERADAGGAASDPTAEPEVAVTPEPEAEPTAAPTVEPPAPTAEPTAVTPEEEGPPAIEPLLTLELLDVAEAAWRQSGIIDYEYVFVESCECDDRQRRPRLVTVRDGQVVGVTIDGEPSRLSGYTVEDLLRSARGALERGALVDMAFDENGVPVYGVVDVEATWVDGGFVFKVGQFETLDDRRSDRDTVEAELRAAYRRWRATGIDTYTMTYSRVCFCPPTEVTVDVIDGEIVAVTVVAEDVAGSAVEDALTVEELFRTIRRAIADGADSIDVDYHPTEGRPVSIFIDRSPMIADEEFGYEVLSFEKARSTDPGRDRRPVAFCNALDALIELDDEPQTTTEARRLLGEIIRWAEVMEETAPRPLQDGAAEFTRFLELVAELAEANDWDPAFFDRIDDELLDDPALDVELIDAFVLGAEEICDR